MSASQRVVLTGATGLVGGAVLRSLVAQKIPVLVLARDPERIAANVEKSVCHLDNLTPEVAARIRDFKPSAFIHSGWAGTDNSERNHPQFVHPNLQSSMQLLEIAANAGCKQWISFGSQAEYSPNLAEDISENAPTWPDTTYGMTKLALCHAEQALCSTSGINFAWLRLFTCYGREYKPSYVIPYLIEKLKSGNLPELRTPHAVWDCMHVDDAASAVMTVLANGKRGGVYNLAYGKGTSVGEMALILAEHLKFPDIEKLRAQIASNTVPETRRVADISRFKRDFGWSPAIDMRQGLKTCL